MRLKEHSLSETEVKFGLISVADVREYEIGGNKILLSDKDTRISLKSV